MRYSLNFDGDFVDEYLKRHGLTSGPSRSREAVYQTMCWADYKTDDEIRAEIERVETKARTHHYQWNEVGNVSDDYARAETLRYLLYEMGVVPDPNLTTL